MIWLPLGLMAATLTLAETRRLTGAQGGWMGLALPLVFSAAALWLLGWLFVSVDMLALAKDSKAALLAFDAMHYRLNTAILALLGLGLGFSGAARSAGLVALADPDEPAPSLFLPVLTAVLGGVLVLVAFSRL
ncbi:hypothetical protein [Sediminicoccus sp. KRV36]|uniref:hypothetical protein n=1 Tax=Sediminicoccus sp. KRV36 TaxID=3133721 RepID=UPI00200EB2DF|nr:hypothetical protein [Sediminicoccus rosea]UPY37178.1 hypothetical protein LHU95_00345 [Sediminicoccus rosea]